MAFEDVDLLRDLRQHRRDQVQVLVVVPVHQLDHVGACFLQRVHQAPDLLHEVLEVVDLLYRVLVKAHLQA